MTHERNLKTKDDVARARAFWTANRPGEPSAPAYVPDPPVWWHAALALVAALLVQTTLAPYLTFRGAAPPLVALVVGWYATRSGMLLGLTFGLIAGSCEDALAGATGTAWTFATGLAGLCAGRLFGTWVGDTLVAIVPGAALLTALRFGAFAVLMHVQGRPLAEPLAHFHALAWQSLEAAALAFVLVRRFPELGGAGAHRR